MPYWAWWLKYFPYVPSKCRLHKDIYNKRGISCKVEILKYLCHFRYESTENMTIQCSTKVCSFGKQVVEKVETEYARFEGGRFVYKLLRSPMCEYMINFILKLKHLPETYMKNSVLENFTILQVNKQNLDWIENLNFYPLWIHRYFI